MMMAETPRPNPPELLDLLAAAEAGKIEPDTLESAMEYLGGPEVVLTLQPEPRQGDLDPAVLSEEDDATGSTRGIGAGYRSLHGDEFHMVSVWRLPVPPGRPGVCGAFHDDQGAVVEVLGPVADVPALRAALATRGSIED